MVTKIRGKRWIIDAPGSISPIEVPVVGNKRNFSFFSTSFERANATFIACAGLVLVEENAEDGVEAAGWLVTGRGKAHGQLKEVHSPERTLLHGASQCADASA